MSNSFIIVAPSFEIVALPNMYEITKVIGKKNDKLL